MSFDGIGFYEKNREVHHKIN